MASHREGVNPLRPYYIPPSIGDASEPVSGLNNSGGGGGASRTLPHGNGTTPYSHKARDIFADLDYKDYISEPSPSAVQSARDIVDELLWRYTSVLMAQPFEVAKTILQVRSQDSEAGHQLPVPVPMVTVAEPELLPRKHRSHGWGDATDLYGGYESDPDEPSYFTPNVPNTSLPLYPAQGRRAISPYGAPPLSPAVPATTASEQQLVLTRPDSILEVISQLWQKEGAWGVWKGTNASFLYTVLQSLLETWSRSLLSAVFNVPDLGLRDDVDRLIDIASPYPWASLFVAAAAAVATGLVLAPLDLVRTRLIITPTSTGVKSRRRALSILRSLPSYACPPLLVLPTILHSLIHPLLTLSAPLVLRTRFMIDKDVSPVAFSVAKFCSSSLALFVKLPLETVLRRGQASILSSPEYVKAIEPALRAKPSTTAATTMETIFPLGPYKGVVGTMTHIVLEEGTSAVAESQKVKGAARALSNVTPRKSSAKTKVAETIYRRGQGMEGLWRGYKVSWWGLVGLWTAAAVGGGGDGQF